jgi:hypothetical protein
MRISWLTWTWPTLILLSTLAVALIVFLFPGIGARPIVIMCFLFVIPGVTVVRFFRLNELVIELMLAIVLSFTIDAFVAGIILYAGVWSPKNIMSFLIGFCFAGAIAQLAIVRPASALYENTEVTIDLSKILPSHIEEDEVTIDLSKILHSHIKEDEVTIDLSELLSSHIEEDDATINLKNMRDTEDTKKWPVVSPQLHQSPLEDTQEKTVPYRETRIAGEGSLKR